MRSINIVERFEGEMKIMNKYKAFNSIEGKMKKNPITWHIAVKAAKIKQLQQSNLYR